jgi:hypothetical protein
MAYRFYISHACVPFTPLIKVYDLFYHLYLKKTAEALLFIKKKRTNTT